MSLNDILEIERERRQRERATLITVYERLQNRINMSVRNARAHYCIYTIPDFIPGYPLINIDKTMKYLLKKLKREGFIAAPVDHKNIFITWDPQTIRELDRTDRNDNQSSTNNRRTDNIVPNIEDDILINSLIRAKRSSK